MAAKKENDIFHDTFDDNFGPGLTLVGDEFMELRGKLLQSLNASEIDIYLLLQKDAKRISEIAEFLGFDRTIAYSLVSSLQNKGLVTATFTSPIKFTAVWSEKAFQVMREN